MATEETRNAIMAHQLMHEERERAIEHWKKKKKVHESDPYLINDCFPTRHVGTTP